MLIAACTTYEEGPQGLSLSEEELSFSSSAGQKVVTIVTAEKWDITDIPDWIKVEDINSDNFRNFEWTISLSATANDGYDRNGTIVFQSKSYTQSLTVSQEGNKGRYVAVESVSLDETELFLAVGDSRQLTASVLPKDASDNTVSWETSSPGVASVDKSGKVTAVSTGTATITATTKDGSKTATCIVTVSLSVVKVTSVSLNKTALTLALGESETLLATIQPSNASNKAVAWQSSNESVATVDGDGKVKAVGDGSAIITVTTKDGSKEAYCNVTVNSAVVNVTGVSLNTASLALEVGQAGALSATVLPDNATNKSVTWSSSNSSIAVVSSSGRVTAIAVGTATIIVTTEDGSKTDQCTVTVSAATTGSINGHEWVDLGLSSGLKWATCNVGASFPEDFGNHYAWGEVTTKSDYSWTNYKFHASGDSYNKYKFSKYVIDSNRGTVDNKTILELSDDAAHANWGGSWRMPTKEEMTELVSDCIWTWTTNSGKSGYQVTSKNNGSSIFLPAAGICYSHLQDEGTKGAYLSSSLQTNSYNLLAYAIIFGYSFAYLTVDGYNYGFSVRPVTDEGVRVSVTGVTLDRTSIEMIRGNVTTIAASVFPTNATQPNIIWSSSNTSIAKVDCSGTVTAVSSGTATITATTYDGAKTAKCTITVSGSSSGIIHGHEWVDLALPSGLKWATCNVGASLPGAYGDYFAWGEVTAKSEYSWNNYRFSASGSSANNKLFSKYNTQSKYGLVDNITILDQADDAAQANWGGTWRMPTDAEFLELRNNCTWTWISQDGKEGYKFTSKNNGNSIFLPAAGYMNSSSICNGGTGGEYWSSTLHSTPDCGWYFPFSSSGVYYGGWSSSYGRACGRPVRPVTDEGVRVSVTGVNLDKNSISMLQGETEVIVATVIPSTATQSGVIWSSSDASVATVDFNGTITAISSGTTTICATTYDGAKTAECIVTVSTYSTTREINGYQWVDMGLPSGLKWATCNVGASSPKEEGYLFAWGEISTKDSYEWATYKFRSSGEIYGDKDNLKLSKYITISSRGPVDNKTTLEMSDDAAHVNWGTPWRMPTANEIDELRMNCTWTWTSQGDWKGYKVTSKINGNSIFLPAAGVSETGTSRIGRGSSGYYWSSSLKPDNPTYALCMAFNSSEIATDHSGLHDSARYNGFSVRPVTE